MLSQINVQEMKIWTIGWEEEIREILSYKNKIRNGI